MSQSTDDFNMALIPKYWSVAKNIEYIKSRESQMRELYLNHNQNVIDTVPPEDLLVWNVRDGWEPLRKLRVISELQFFTEKT